MTSNIMDDVEKFQNHYESLYRTISSQVKKLPSFPTEPQEEEILRILETDVDKLFQGAFQIGADKKKKDYSLANLANNLDESPFRSLLLRIFSLEP